MKLLHFLAISILIFSLSSCVTSYRIISDFESDVDYSTFQSYKVLNPKDGFPAGANPINKQRFTRAIQSEMNDLGFLQSEQPDLLVTWFVKVKDVRVVDVYDDHYDKWEDVVPRREYNYKEGTLVVDLVDTKKRQIIWHGKTSATVYEDMRNVEEKIQRAINDMFNQLVADVNLNKAIVEAHE